MDGIRSERLNSRKAASTAKIGLESVQTLNETYSSVSTRRRYEVWFLRMALASGGGAWWFRYLLMNPGRCGCGGNPRGKPVQVWAIWFPHEGKPQSFIQGFSLEGLDLSAKGQAPFHFRIGSNGINDNSCQGAMEVEGHSISWDLHYRSTFRTTLSDKGWIGFSRTPHSDACFSGRITFDDRSFGGDPLGFGVQGHNCGYRHRNFWTWAHAYLLGPGGRVSTLEALVYDMPFGLVFRKAVLWHDGEAHVFRRLEEGKRDPKNLQWEFRCVARDGWQMDVALDGRGPNLHRLPYLKTDCTGSFEVANNSLARAAVQVMQRDGGSVEEFETTTGAVLEMAGHR